MWKGKGSRMAKAILTKKGKAVTFLTPNYTRKL